MAMAPYQVILGIDPGRYGALCLLHVKTGSLLGGIPMPDDIKFTYAWLYKMRDRYEDQIFIVMEQAHPNPVKGASMSSKSAFTYGRHFGQLEAAIMALKLPMQLLNPVTWTAEMHKGTYAKEPKAKSLEAAQRLWPQMAFKFSEGAKKEHDGLVDSMLIAEWARRKLFQGEKNE